VAHKICDPFHIDTTVSCTKSK